MNYEHFNHKRNSFLEMGKIYFWTATINKWKKILIEDKYKEIILRSLEYLSINGNIDVFAFVIMPNHIHIIWKLMKMNGKEMPHASFLKFTSHNFKKKLKIENPDRLVSYRVNASNKLYEFWQRDALGIHLYTENVAYQKLDYIHANPTADRWNLVPDPCQYKYSTARFYEMGIRDYEFIKDLREEF